MRSNTSSSQSYTTRKPRPFSRAPYCKTVDNKSFNGIFRNFSVTIGFLVLRISLSRRTKRTGFRIHGTVTIANVIGDSRYLGRPRPHRRMPRLYRSSELSKSQKGFGGHRGSGYWPCRCSVEITVLWPHLMGDVPALQARTSTRTH